MLIITMGGMMKMEKNCSILVVKGPKVNLFNPHGNHNVLRENEYIKSLWNKFTV